MTVELYENGLSIKQIEGRIGGIPMGRFAKCCTREESQFDKIVLKGGSQARQSSQGISNPKVVEKVIADDFSRSPKNDLLEEVFDG